MRFSFVMLDEDKVFKALLRLDFTIKEIKSILITNHGYTRRRVRRRVKEIKSFLINNHGYTRRRVRRRVRPSGKLAEWLSAIFNAFGPLRCSNIQKVLLKQEENKKERGKRRQGKGQRQRAKAKGKERQRTKTKARTNKGQRAKKNDKGKE
jgi:hypothetical protein